MAYTPPTRKQIRTRPGTMPDKLADELKKVGDEIANVTAGEIVMPEGTVLVGTAAGVGAGVAMSGDATIAVNGAVTIANDAITNAKVAPGLIQQATITLAGGAQNAIAGSWENPEAGPIMVWLALVDVTTPGGTAGAKLNGGSAAEATTPSDNLIDGVDANTAGVSTSSCAGLGAGANGKGAVKLTANGGALSFLTFQITDAEAAALVGKAYIYYFKIAA